MDILTYGALLNKIKEAKPTDEQVAQAVEGWLDDHPEATTTVQDGSITYVKLDNNLKDIADGIPDIKNQALNSYTTSELSGSIVSFSDGADSIPVKTLTVDIESNIGVTEATITRCRKNLVPYPYGQSSVTADGVTFTARPDGSVKVQGTATGNQATYVMLGDVRTKNALVVGQRYKVTTYNGGNSGYGPWDDCWFQVYSEDSSSIVNPDKGYNEFTWNGVASGNTCNMAIRVANGKTVDTVVYPMVRLASDSDSNYEPPTANGAYTFDWSSSAGAIMSGVLDVVVGKLISGGVEYSIAPVEINTLLGNNIIYSNCGDISVEYRIDPESIINGVSSVSGKTGDVTLCAGDVAFNEQDSYESGTVGIELTDLKSQVGDLVENLYTDSDVVAGGSMDFANEDTFAPGLGNIRYFSSTFDSEYEINKIKIRAYKNAGAAYKFKLITVEFSGTSVYVRSVGSEITLDAPSEAYTDYTIALENPFIVPAGQMVGVCASDDKWLYYSESGSDVSYYVRTQSYADIVADFRLQVYLPPLYTGKLPVTFYSGGKEFIHIFNHEEIEEIVDAATENLSVEIEDVTARVNELAENKNTISSFWQSGVWNSNSSDSVAQNDRYICTTNAVPDNAGIIINDDTTNYKYVITGFDMSATYHGKGTYNVSTGAFEMYVNNFITVKEFDLDALRKKFPAYEFRISLCKTVDAVVTVAAYSVLRFMNYRSYDKAYIDNSLSINKAIYVSATGDDTNSGLISTEPVATVNRALELGATDVLISGGVYEQTIDLSKCNNPFVRLKNITATGRVIFYAPDSLIASSETKVSGYTKVYSASTTHTFPDTTSKIFQDGVADASTEIGNAERHPIQRGNFYRCEDTKINKCTSSTLSDALNEIDNADTYKWFYNGGTIYFSRPQEINASHPLRTGLYDTVFLKNGDRGKSVEMVGIEIKYMRLDLDFSGARIVDCKVACACGGGIMYNDSIALELIRCEAVNAYSGNLGDGIYATGSSSYGMAKGTTVTMMDCWVHDNNDDGFSDHIGCESTIIGGLYEYNGKGGVLPTGGGNCTCYSVTSRNNTIGFEIAGGSGPVASGRNGQQIECRGCVADGNTQYGYFAAGNQDMTMRLVNCIALNNGVGYSGSTATGSDLIAINCVGYGNTTLKGQAVTVITADDLT